MQPEKIKQNNRPIMHNNDTNFFIETDAVKTRNFIFSIYDQLADEVAREEDHLHQQKNLQKN